MDDEGLEILEELVGEPDLGLRYNRDWDRTYCQFCHIHEREERYHDGKVWLSRWHVDHEPACPIFRARAYLKVKLEERRQRRLAELEEDD